MFDRLTTLPHGLRVFVEALLYGLQHHWIEVGDRVELGADVDRYSFIVVDLHHLLLAGLPAHFESYHPSHAVGSLWGGSQPLQPMKTMAAEPYVHNVPRRHSAWALSRSTIDPQTRTALLLM